MIFLENIKKFKNECLEKSHNISNKNKKKIIREEIIIHDIDLILWLKSQSIYPKIYWKNRDDDFEIAGIGFADKITGFTNFQLKKCFDSIKSNIIFNNDLKYFGGISFDFNGKKEESFNLFKGFHFYLPKFELINNKNCYTFAYNYLITKFYDKELLSNKIINDFTYLQNTSHVKNFHDFSNYNIKSEIPSKKDFFLILYNILNRLKNNNLKKVVLAKRYDLTFKNKISPIDFIHYFKKIKNKSYRFCFQFFENIGFVGCSPERLYKKEKNKIFTEALAGTRVRGKTLKIDKLLEQDLLTNKKDKKEHLIVHDFIKNFLNKICISYNESQIGIKKFISIQHLITKFEGILKKNIEDINIIKTLHPTPAVCGLPVNKAKKNIKLLEKFDRGWYGGPIGWIGNNSSEFSVAIRSGIVNENVLSFFCGAGIISESIPEDENLEIENKFKSFLKIIGEI